MVKNLTCVECPVGCQLQVQMEGEQILSISGNGCPRGKMYAQTEVVRPMRVLTTTVKCQDGSVVSVKTDRPIPKDLMLNLMQTINQATPSLPIKIGQVIIENLWEDVNLIATSNKE